MRFSPAPSAGPRALGDGISNFSRRCSHFGDWLSDLASDLDTSNRVKLRRLQPRMLPSVHSE